MPWSPPDFVDGHQDLPGSGYEADATATTEIDRIRRPHHENRPERRIGAASQPVLSVCVHAHRSSDLRHKRLLQIRRELMYGRSARTSLIIASINFSSSVGHCSWSR
jgi:hypothetical protein